MKKRLMLLLLFSTLMIIAKPKNILIYTHTSPKYYIHSNIDKRALEIKKICEGLSHKATISGDPEVFTDEKLKNIDCIIFCYNNDEAFTTEEQRNAFMKFTRRGGAFVGVHSAASSEPKWPWFVDMMGGLFIRHPAEQKFTIKVIDANHPATKHLKPEFARFDECYNLQLLNPDIKILLAADLSTVTDEEKYKVSQFGKYIPLSWYHNFDGGRQFFTALGHPENSFEDPDFVNHIKGGIIWALAGKN
jgi:uncharacterized protein